LIELYSDHPKSVENGTIFPFISNQRMNGYLKEIADVCGITKRLTFHIARHTFATTITVSNGVPIESVSKMLGHTTIRTTQIYAKVIENKLSEDMGRLK
jgi:site-specific recombinase XerD